MTPSLEVDTAKLYGAEWAFLAKTPPWQTVAAEGSEVAVFPADTE